MRERVACPTLLSYSDDKGVALSAVALGGKVMVRSGGEETI